ncbi:DUF2628 domain-containing protein [Rhodococcus maanshanensis]|jgi:hypothetical protein|uniref:DUF2628 domain-containing protein n=1 Tax=Rhodococcus maanshanensis TaxID=183556 RepID=UPI0022B3F0BA|nr:DUF2628 domain-containing protein [Rhodococcus maanshanensis]MCZ4555656.1 DUF2628 domain-containing protein [Rhodococcus maanshanensis]
MTPTHLNPTAPASGLGERWMFRFDFFAQHGLPGLWKNSPEWVAAFKALPFGRRMILQFNWLAALFGFVYLFAKGLWRKAVAFIALGVAYGIVATFADTPAWLDRGVAIGLAVFCATRANVYVYEKKVLGKHTWSL